MKIVLDGLEYDEYPTELERVARLVADRDAWRREAMRYARVAPRCQECDLPECQRGDHSG